jgi:F-type H+-transporting ATPase subunit b
MPAFLTDPTFWVAIGFVVLFIFIWKPLTKGISGGLDKRAADIKRSLDEARQLADEAQRILAENQKKSREASREIDRMVERAHEEAERIVADSRAKLEAALTRREQLAREKIALAEADAARQVRDVAVEVAVATTRALIAARLDKAAGDRMIDSAIGEIPQRLH